MFCSRIKPARVIAALIVVVGSGLATAHANNWHGQYEANTAGPPAVTHIGPGVTSISIMVGKVAGDTHFVFSRNTRPGFLVGYNLVTGEITHEIEVVIDGDRSLSANSMASIGNDLYVGVNFENRRASIVRFDMTTGAFEQAASIHPANSAQAMTTSPDGKIFVTSDQQNRATLYEYDPATGQLTNHGSFENNPRQSANGVVATEDYVFIGIGGNAPDLWSFNRQTGERKSILPPEFRSHEGVMALGLHEQYVVVGARGPASEPIVALVSLDDPDDYILVNHNHNLVQSIAVHEDKVFFGSGEGVWEYDIQTRVTKRLTGMAANRSLDYRDGKLHGTDGRRYIGSFDLTTGAQVRLDLAVAGTSEWAEPPQSILYLNNHVYVAGHHAIGIHNLNNGSYRSKEVSGEAKQMTVTPSGIIYMVMYTSGNLLRFDPFFDSVTHAASSPDFNNRARSVYYDEKNNLVYMGTQADNRGGGAFTVHDPRLGDNRRVDMPFPNHAVGAVLAIEGTAYIAGYQGRLDSGTSAPARAYNPLTMEQLWELIPVPGDSRIRSLVNVRGDIMGLTRSGELFVIDPREQTVIYRQKIMTDEEEPGRLVVRGDLVIAVSERRIMRLDPETYAHQVIVDHLDGFWFHWPDAAIDGEGNIYALSNLDLVKIAASTDTTAPTDADTPLRLTLHQNYPNPFNPSTRIRYDLPETSNVRFTLFDITGRIILERSKGLQSPGTHEWMLDAASLSSGVYLLRIQTDTAMDQVRMTLIR